MLRYSKYYLLFLPVVKIEPPTDFTKKFIKLTPISDMALVLQDNSELIFRTYKPNAFINTMSYYLLLSCTILFIDFAFFNLIFLIISAHIEFISIFGLLNRSLQPCICAASLRHFILQYSSFHKSSWFTFSFYIWSTISHFSISPRLTAFRCSFRVVCITLV